MKYGTPDLKRVLDIIVSLAAILLTGGILALSAIAIAFSSKGPIFFLQNRAGLKGQPFKIFKLRTMHVNKNRSIGQTTNSDPEVFFIGKLLRRLKIDELPQIFNVLVGDMSIVGPRPCLMETAREMPDWAKARFNVRPGITGLAQINGNIALSWEERWRYDVLYTNTHTVLGDISIILKTILVVLLGEALFRRPQ